MTGWRVGWMVVPEPLVRPIERLQQNLDLGADAVADRRRGRVRRPRRDGKGQARLPGEPPHPDRRACRKPASTNFCPPTARSISMPTSRNSPPTVSSSPNRCWNRRTSRPPPGIDFDPVHGHRFIRFSYARSADEMREAVARIARWLDEGCPSPAGSAVAPDFKLERGFAIDTVEAKLIWLYRAGARSARRRTNPKILTGE